MKKQLQLILFMLAITLSQVPLANSSATDGDFIENNSVKKQTINLREGANFVSFYLMPENTNLKAILKPLIDEGSLIIAMDEIGNVLWPDRNIDDIGKVNFEKGYTVKVNKDTTLELEGVSLPYPFYLNLDAGWSLMSYPSSEKEDALVALESLIKIDVLEKARDENGLEVYLSKNEWVNEIGDFVPGKAYEISLKESAKLLTKKPFTCGDSFNYEDQDYKTVQINDRCWMAENLNVGTKINGSRNQGNNKIVEKYCINNNETNCDKLGGLYQWSEVMNYSIEEKFQGICPSNWHIPTDYEWFLMENYLDSSITNRGARGFRGDDAGDILKEGGESGFEAKITGYRYDAVDQPFQGADIYAYFWTSTKSTDDSSWARSLNSTYTTINRNKYPYTWLGYSVRCIKNVE